MTMRVWGRTSQKKLAESIDMLCDSEDEKETLLALNDELKKMRRKQKK